MRNTFLEHLKETLLEKDVLNRWAAVSNVLATLSYFDTKNEKILGAMK